jgi:hypothetical protein
VPDGFRGLAAARATRQAAAELLDPLARAHERMASHVFKPGMRGKGGGFRSAASANSSMFANDNRFFLRSV